MQQIAAYWLVLELTDSPVAVGALALVQMLPVTRARALRRLDRRPGRPAADGDLPARRVLLAAGGGARGAGARPASIAVWQLYALGLRPGHRRRTRRARAAHARLPDRRPGRPRRTRSASARASARPRASSARRSAASSSRSPAPGVAFGLNAVSYAIVIGCLLAIRLAPRPPRDRAAARRPRRRSPRRSASPSARGGSPSTFFTVLLVARSRSTSTCCCPSSRS